MQIAEFIGLTLIGYGIWFGFRGIKIYFSTDKSWWRYPSRKERYPYPVAGLLLSLVFVLAGLVFVLYHTFGEQARAFGYAAGAAFILVLVIGIAQPPIFHPKWYARLQKKFGKKGVAQLKTAAYKMPLEEWQEIAASHDVFTEWATKTAPAQTHHHSRGYKKSGD